VAGSAGCGAVGRPVGGLVVRSHSVEGCTAAWTVVDATAAWTAVDATAD
jgi:hypothetical protein